MKPSFPFNGGICGSAISPIFTDTSMKVKSLLFLIASLTPSIESTFTTFLYPVAFATPLKFTDCPGVGYPPTISKAWLFNMMCTKFLTPEHPIIGNAPICITVEPSPSKQIIFLSGLESASPNATLEQWPIDPTTKKSLSCDYCCFSRISYIIFDINPPAETTGLF